MTNLVHQLSKESMIPSIENGSKDRSKDARNAFSSLSQGRLRFNMSDLFRKNLYIYVYIYIYIFVSEQFPFLNLNGLSCFEHFWVVALQPCTLRSSASGGSRSSWLFQADLLLTHWGIKELFRLAKLLRRTEAGWIILGKFTVLTVLTVFWGENTGRPSNN